MKNTNNRWEQRFVHFNQAFTQLEIGLQLGRELSLLERAGLIKTFEFTFELGWKTLKDFLENEGIFPKTPRETIQEAFKANLITDDAHLWIDALEKRNFLSHCYDRGVSVQAEDVIRKSYYHFLKKFQEYFSSKISDAT